MVTLCIDIEKEKWNNVLILFKEIEPTIDTEDKAKTYLQNKAKEYLKTYLHTVKKELEVSKIEKTLPSAANML